MKKVLLFILYYSPIASLFLVYKIFPKIFETMSWFLVLMVFLIGLFLIEMFKVFENKERAWQKFSLKDKILFFISTAIWFLFFIYPIKENKSPEIIFFFSIIGMIITCIIIVKFGSENLKKHIFFPFY